MAKEIIDTWGRIDVLVNNAGITRDTLLMRMKQEDFEDVIQVNLVGTFQVTKHVIPYMMKQREGRIINISSVVGVSGNAGQTNYSASKAGIIGFTKSLAKEVASRNILVNAVAPGMIATQMTEVLKDEVKEEIAKAIAPQFADTKEETSAAIVTRYQDQDTWKTDVIFTQDAFTLLLDILDESDQLKARPEYDVLVNTEFAEKAAQ